MFGLKAVNELKSEVASIIGKATRRIDQLFKSQEDIQDRLEVLEDMVDAQYAIWESALSARATMTPPTVEEETTDEPTD